MQHENTNSKGDFYSKITLFVLQFSDIQKYIWLRFGMTNSINKYLSFSSCTYKFKWSLCTENLSLTRELKIFQIQIIIRFDYIQKNYIKAKKITVHHKY